MISHLLPSALRVRTLAASLALCISGWSVGSMAVAETPTLKAQISEPPNGSTMATTSLHLRWTSGLGATSHALWVGTTPGGSDIFSTSYPSTTVREQTVPIPATGNKIYVRLWSMIGDAYQSNDYFFLAPPAEKAQFVSPTPANGAQLTDGTLSCSWSAGIGVSKYVLWVGSSEGGYDLAAVDKGTALSHTFTNIVTDGGPVYVTLWSLVGGAYQGNGRWFTTAMPANTTASRPAVLTSPACGSTLTSGTLNLAWDAGVSATQYAVWVGATPGGYNLHNVSAGTSRTATVTVPTLGARIYVTLHSMIGGVWQSNDYWFTCSGTDKHDPAVVTVPTEGAFLTSGTLSAQWTQGINVRASSPYAYALGQFPSGTDLTGGTLGTSNQSVSIPGLPNDGRPLFFTLSTAFSDNSVKSTNTWFYAPNTATGNKVALLEYPANGTTLNVTSNTFSWTTGTGASQYALWIGNSAGAYDLFTFSNGLTRSSPNWVPPIDGRQLYTTLYTMIGGQWKAVHYLLKAPVPGKAEFTAPLSGTTFTSDQATFEWTAGAGVTNYALWISRVPGGTTYEIHSSTGLTQSRAVTLPQDGSPIYARLFSMINGAWQSTDAFYQAHAAAVAPLVITTASLPDGEVKWTYSGPALAATGGYGTRVWSVAGGALPAGLSLAADGTLSGRPLAAGTFPLTLKVTDDSLYSATRPFTLTVAPQRLTILGGAGDSGGGGGSGQATFTLPAGNQYVSYSGALSAEGGTGTGFVWSLGGGALPAGLSLAPDGSISGTPTGSGTFALTFGVMDSAGATATAAGTLTIIPEPPLDIVTTELSMGEIEVPFSGTLAATGGSGTGYVWTKTAGHLHDGLSFHSDGTVDGTPTEAGRYSIGVRVTDSRGNTATASVAVKIWEEATLEGLSSSLVGGFVPEQPEKPEIVEERPTWVPVGNPISEDGAEDLNAYNNYLATYTTTSKYLSEKKESREEPDPLDPPDGTKTVWDWRVQFYQLINVTVTTPAVPAVPADASDYKVINESADPQETVLETRTSILARSAGGEPVFQGGNLPGVLAFVNMTPFDRQEREPQPGSGGNNGTILSWASNGSYPKADWRACWLRSGSRAVKESQRTWLIRCRTRLLGTGAEIYVSYGTATVTLDEDEKVSERATLNGISVIAGNAGWVTESNGVVYLTPPFPDYGQINEVSLLPAEIVAVFGHEWQISGKNRVEMALTALVDEPGEFKNIGADRSIFAIKGKPFGSQTGEKLWVIQTAHDEATLKSALSSIPFVVFEGHSNYGLGPCFDPTSIRTLRDFTNFGNTHAAIDAIFAAGHSTAFPNFQAVPDAEIAAHPHNYTVLPTRVNKERFPNINGVGPQQFFWDPPHEAQGQKYHFVRTEIADGANGWTNFLIVDAGKEDVPALGYQLFFYNACSTARDYAEVFRHGDLIMSNDSVWPDYGGTEAFLKGLVAGKSKADILTDVNQTHVGKQGAAQPSYRTFSWP